MNKHNLITLLENYELSSKEIREWTSFGEGLIHQTYRLKLAGKDYLLQGFNTNVFQRPDLIATNLSHLNELKAQVQLPFQLPLPMPTLTGELLVVYQNKHYRLFEFVEGITLQQTESPEIASLAAAAYGKFAAWGDQLHIADLAESIPNFHRLDHRFLRFQKVLSNKLSLSSSEQELVEFYLSQSKLIEKYLEFLSTLPLRLTHNDTKLNNLILSKDLSSVAAIIDLDTIMPGFLLYDFGDLVRTVACTEPETSRDWRNANLNLDLFEALLSGYLEGLDGSLNSIEKESLLIGGEVMTCLMGLRFFTDHLEGNMYYKVSYEEQNLDRAKNQANFLKNQQSHRQDLKKIIKNL